MQFALQLALASPQNGSHCLQLGVLQSQPSSTSNVKFILPIAYDGLRRSGACQKPMHSDRKSLTSSYKAVSERQAKKVVTVVATVVENQEDPPPISELPFSNFINQEGRIQPYVPIDTAATIFAVFDQNKKAQYIGFAKDIRNTLRCLMGRRPELCYFYKVYSLPTLDKEKMLAVRTQWVSELGKMPHGNSDSWEKKLWEQPADSQSISERGKAGAAASKAKTIQQILRDRGLEEEIVFDPNLLEEGKCEILPSKELSREDIINSAEYQEQFNRCRKKVSIPIPGGGGDLKYEIVYEMKFVTNGGWMYDVLVLKDEKETRHRIICGRDYPDALQMPEDEVIERIIAFLLHNKVTRHTEGMMETGAFPSNYFAVSEVAHSFDGVDEWFNAILPDNVWRFRRDINYGHSAVPAPGRSSDPDATSKYSVPGWDGNNI